MSRPLSSHRILLTAGPTREPLDPVRYLSNHSSGEMGLTLAAELRRMRADVTVVLGPVSRQIPKGIRVIPVETAREMLAAVGPLLARTSAFIATAAVCDWRFETVHSGKMKKGADNQMTVRLIKNPDILATAGRRNAAAGKGPLLIGFALETGNVVAYARRKMREKNLDLVIGNTPASFGSSRISPIWIERETPARRLPAQSKKSLSSRIGRWIAAELDSR